MAFWWEFGFFYLSTRGFEDYYFLKRKSLDTKVVAWTVELLVTFPDVFVWRTDWSSFTFCPDFVIVLEGGLLFEVVAPEEFMRLPTLEKVPGAVEAVSSELFYIKEFLP